MIRRQYQLARGFESRCYFDNFIDSVGIRSFEEALNPYKATIGKSKRMDLLINVKWHDVKLYTIFVLRWA